MEKKINQILRNQMTLFELKLGWSSKARLEKRWEETLGLVNPKQESIKDKTHDAFCEDSE